MAAHGWSVILLGRARTTKESWRLGDAKVRLVPVQLRPRPHELRSHRLRRPLAYSSPSRARHKLHQVKARRSELLAERGAAYTAAATTNGAVGPARRIWYAVRRRALDKQLAWVDVRLQQTESAAAGRRRMDAPIDRFAIRFWLWLLNERAWRRLDPHLWDYEIAYAPVIDRLKPDLIHANDFRMLGVGARAKARAGNQGRRVALVWDAHEFLPGIEPWDKHPRWHVAQIAHEREYAGAADAVVTVSDDLAGVLMEAHDLPERPSVVLNCPEAQAPVDLTRTPGVRAACGLDDTVPLLVYSGGAAPQRGIDTAIDALPQLPDAHLALVVPSPGAAYVRSLAKRARQLGVEDRLHVLPYVPYDEVAAHLASADVGLIPIHHVPNHELALITKFFEYAHARLPLVVSDVRAMAHEVRRTGQGEVFTAADVSDFVRAVTAVLAAPERYRRAYDAPALLSSWTWEKQAEELDGVYRRTLDRLT